MTARSLWAALCAVVLTLFVTGAGAQPAPIAEYLLGAGDVVRITVYQNPDLTLETRISEAGTLSFPLLGVVKVGGLSTGQAERQIAEGLRSKNLVREPQVNMTVVQVRGNQVAAFGHVLRPGRFPIEVADMKIIDLLALAGGIDAAGAETMVLTGTRDGKPFRREFDVPSMFSPTGRPFDFTVQNGDVLWVDRAPLVYIYGEVQRPGVFRLERGLTVMQALATGGGLTLRGTQKGLRVHRRAPDGSQQILQPAMDDRLQDGDVVYVRESLF